MHVVSSLYLYEVSIAIETAVCNLGNLNLYSKYYLSCMDKIKIFTIFMMLAGVIALNGLSAYAQDLPDWLEEQVRAGNLTRKDAIQLNQSRQKYASSNNVVTPVNNVLNHLLNTSDQEVVKYYNQGLAKYNSADYQGAIKDYSEVLKINPSIALVYSNRGLARAKLGDNRGAIEDCSQALNINSTLDLAYLNRGLAYLNLKEWHKAIDDFSYALRNNTKLPYAYSNRGAAYAELGNDQEALKDLDQALKLNPNMAVAYINRGFIHLHLKQYQAVIEDSNRALQLDPNLQQAYQNRGAARVGLGDKQGAREDLQKAAQFLQSQGKLESYQRIINVLLTLQG
jgi:tetratricopeptide (TPR) repeat protein